MSIADKYNTGKGMRFVAQLPDQVVYMSLNDIARKYKSTDVFIINAMYINTKSKFGNAPVILCGGVLVNLPQHLLTVVQTMLNDDDVINVVNNGGFGFSFYSYQVGNNIYNSVNWVDITQNTRITRL